MVEKIICEKDAEDNYEKLSKDKKRKYQEIYTKAVCNLENYVLSVDIASPNSKDQSCVIKYNYEEYLKGNLAE